MRKTSCASSWPRRRRDRHGHGTSCSEAGRARRRPARSRNRKGSADGSPPRPSSERGSSSGTSPRGTTRSPCPAVSTPTSTSRSPTSTTGCSPAATATRSCRSPTSIAELFRDIVDWLGRMLVRPNLPRPVPEIGWLGIVAVATWLGYAVANWRIALLVLGSFLSFGVFGYWEDSMDLLIVTFVSVAISGDHRDAVGGAGRHERPGQPDHHRVPRLHADDADVRLPATGRAVLRHRCEWRGGVHADLRAAADRSDRGLRHPRGARDHDRGHRLLRTDRTGSGCSRCRSRWRARRSSSGSTRPPWPRSRWPPSRLTSTVPGLGKPVLGAWSVNDFGGSFVPGVLIVVMAVMLDRTTTAASERAEKVARGGGGNPRLRRMILRSARASAHWSRSTSRAPTSVSRSSPSTRRGQGRRRPRRRHGLDHSTPSAA